jgi:hypothetical protein
MFNLIVQTGHADFHVQIPHVLPNLSLMYPFYPHVYPHEFLIFQYY